MLVAGVIHEEGKALKRLRDATNAPIFGYYENNIGEGVVGAPTFPYWKLPDEWRRLLSAFWAARKPVALK